LTIEPPLAAEIEVWRAVLPQALWALLPAHKNTVF
jgi:hypothetical protein